MAIPRPKKTKREHNNSSESQPKANSNQQFNQILDKAVDEQKEAPVICHTTTYGQNSLLQTFHYQSREYHY